MNEYQRPLLLSTIVALLAAAVLTGQQQIRGTDWPRWRGAGFDGTVVTASPAFARPFDLNVRWKRALGAGYSGVVVAGGHAVTMFSDGVTDHVVSLESETGAEEWRVPLAPTFPARDGSSGGPVSTPAIDGSVVYALGPRGDFLAIRLASGEVLWKTDIASKLGAEVPHWGFTTSPLVTGNLVIVFTGGAPDRAVTAFDRKTGAVVWRKGSDEASYQSPMLMRTAGRSQLIVGGERWLVGMDPEDGKELWRHEHGGRGFYAKILNPVVIAPGVLLMTYRPDESVAVRIPAPTGTPEGTASQPAAPSTVGSASLPGTPEVVWSTRELKLNYATPLAHGDLVFGYSGGFLSCIDSRTGALKWRSRPPGDGFPILVDGSLVILTKEGRLTVADASAAGYQERASIELFSRLVWSPPSFAGGRIYGRDSYSEIAAVDIVPRAETPLPSAGAVDAVLPDSAFMKWVRSVEGKPDARTLAKQYLATQPSSPIVEGDRRVHFVYDGPEADVALRGDVLEASQQLPMHRVAGTDLRYASFEVEPDARLAYQFVRNHGEAIADPRNPSAAESLNHPGAISTVLMPRADRSLPAPSTAPLRGRMVEHEIDGGTVRAEHLVWNVKRTLAVYLPPGYDTDTAQRYPVLYVMYGDEMRKGQLDRILDTSIGSTLRPLIAVFIPSTSGFEYARSFREAHRRLLADKVVPFVDRQFRTIADAASRTLWGVDEAGFAAVETPLLEPGLFGSAIAQSVFPMTKADEELLALVDRTPVTSQRFHLDWGRYDPRRESDLLDVPGYTRRLRDRLTARGFKVTGRESNDGSAVAFSIDRAEAILREWFPR